MDDPHQVNTIIATAICDALNDEAGAALVGIEQAKQVGKRVVEALNDADANGGDRRSGRCAAAERPK